MQLSLNKRLSQGFTVLANYTWSKSLGNYSGSAGEANEVAPWNVPNADSYVYGPMDFDYRHRFVVSWVWEPPKVKTDHGPHLFGWDMGFFKSFRLAEQVNLQFRAEMFNIFNQVNFANPNTNVSGGGFGRITIGCFRQCVSERHTHSIGPKRKWRTAHTDKECRRTK